MSAGETSPAEPASASLSGRAFAWRVSVLFAALSVVIGINLPYLPVWLDWVGLTATEIALVTAVPLFVRVLATPVVGYAADRAGNYRGFLIGLSCVSLAALVALALSAGFWSILMCTIAFALAWTAIMPLTETVAMSGVRAAGLDYGRMRLWGSLSFIAATFAGGWIIARAGSGAVVWLIVFGAALTLLAACNLPRPMGPRPSAGAPRLTAAGAFDLLRSRTFLIFLAAAGGVQAAHAVFYTFGTLHWRELGISMQWSGALWAISIIVEVALFAYSRAVLKRIAPASLIALGAGAAVLRWGIMGLDPSPAVLVPLQILHALTFGASHIGAVHFIAETIPERLSGTAQALYATVSGGIAMGGAMLIAGPLYAAYAGRAYWAMAAIAAVSLAAGCALIKASLAAAQPQSCGDGGSSCAPR